MMRARNLTGIGFMITCLALWPLAGAVAQSTGQQSDESVINVNPASKARIQFAAENWDFGSIPRGSTVVHKYVIRNVGEDTLLVTRVRPTCGCTLAPLSNDRIAPGQEAELKTSFNTQKFNGRVNKQIYVDSNDPINPYLKVSFSAIINNPLETIQASPAEVDFGSLKAGEGATAKIKITDNDSTAMDLVIVEQSAPTLFKVQMPSSRIEAHKSIDLAFELMPQANAGEFKESITLEASGRPETRITIPIKGIIAQ